MSWNDAPIHKQQRWTRKMNTKDQSSKLTYSYMYVCVCISVYVSVLQCICGKMLVERYASPWFLTQTFIFLTVSKIALLFRCSTYSLVRVYSTICFTRFVFKFFLFSAHFVFDKAEIFSKNEHCCSVCMCLYMCIVQAYIVNAVLHTLYTP